MLAANSGSLLDMPARTGICIGHRQSNEWAILPWDLDLSMDGLEYAKHFFDNALYTDDWSPGHVDRRRAHLFNIPRRAR